MAASMPIWTGKRAAASAIGRDGTRASRGGRGGPDDYSGSAPLSLQVDALGRLQGRPHRLRDHPAVASNSSCSPCSSGVTQASTRALVRIGAGPGRVGSCRDSIAAANSTASGWMMTVPHRHLADHDDDREAHGRQPFDELRLRVLEPPVRRFTTYQTTWT